MKKRDIIHFIKKIIKEQAYGSATLTTQGQYGSRFTKTGRPPGVMENIKSFDPDTINLVREILDAADIYHNDLVDSYDEVSSYLDKRTGGTIIKFPHYNGPGGRGALFGRGTVDRIDSEKAKAKAAALKTYTKFKTYIEDYEISDKSPAGVYGNIYLWVMFNDLAKDYSAPKGGTQSSQFEMHDFEKKYGDKIKPDDFKNNPKLQPGKVVMYGGTRYKVLENTGYVLTLQSVESDKIKKVNLNQFISQGAIKEKNMKKIKEATTKTYAGVDAMAAIEKDPRFGTLQGDSKKDIKDKLKGGGTVELEEENPVVAKGDGIEITQDEMDKLHRDGRVRLKNGNLLVFPSKPLKVKEKISPDDEEENQSQDDIAMGVDDAKDFMEAYIKERGDDNLKEHVNKYHKRSMLMEGAMKKFFEMFDQGKTDEEIVLDYAQKGTTVPESFVTKARRQYEGMKKMKLELEMSEKEFRNSSEKMVNNAEEGMEEDKQLSSGLFNE